MRAACAQAQGYAGDAARLDGEVGHRLLAIGRLGHGVLVPDETEDGRIVEMMGRQHNRLSRAVSSSSRARNIEASLAPMKSQPPSSSRRALHAKLRSIN